MRGWKRRKGWKENKEIKYVIRWGENGSYRSSTCRLQPWGLEGRGGAGVACYRFNEMLKILRGETNPDESKQIKKNCYGWCYRNPCSYLVGHCATDGSKTDMFYLHSEEQKGKETADVKATHKVGLLKLACFFTFVTSSSVMVMTKSFILPFIAFSGVFSIVCLQFCDSISGAQTCYITISTTVINMFCLFQGF